MWFPYADGHGFFLTHAYKKTNSVKRKKKKNLCIAHIFNGD